MGDKNVDGAVNGIAKEQEIPKIHEFLGVSRGSLVLSFEHLDLHPTSAHPPHTQP